MLNFWAISEISLLKTVVGSRLWWGVSWQTLDQQHTYQLLSNCTESF